MKKSINCNKGKQGNNSQQNGLKGTLYIANDKYRIIKSERPKQKSSHWKNLPFFFCLQNRQQVFFILTWNNLQLVIPHHHPVISLVKMKPYLCSYQSTAVSSSVSPVSHVQPFLLPVWLFSFFLPSLFFCCFLLKPPALDKKNMEVYTLRTRKNNKN